MRYHAVVLVFLLVAGTTFHIIVFFSVVLKSAHILHLGVALGVVPIFSVHQEPSETEIVYLS